MKPTWQAEGVQLYLGDCLEVLPTLEADSVDAVVTDPPYGMNNNTNYARFSGGSDNSIAKRGAGRDYGHQIVGDNKPFDPTPWLNFPRVVLWGMNHYAAKLPIGSVLVWIKRNDAAFGSFLSDAELAWMKNGHGVYCRKDLSMNAIARSRVHPNQKPVSLLIWCIEKARVPDAGAILDPFMGSGTTGVACVKTGRKFIGIEIDEGYFEIAKERIQEAMMQPQLEGM